MHHQLRLVQSTPDDKQQQVPVKVTDAYQDSNWLEPELVKVHVLAVQLVNNQPLITEVVLLLLLVHQIRWESVEVVNRVDWIKNLIQHRRTVFPLDAQLTPGHRSITNVHQIDVIQINKMSNMIISSLVKHKSKVDV